MIGGAALALLAALAGGGAYVYFFSGLRTSPTQLGLSSSPAPSSSTVSTAIAGTWTVTTGSLAGYRVKELFAGETSKHEAVARTSAVSGGMTVAGDATSGFMITDISITADLTKLHSVDSVAGRDVTQRDGVVFRQLDLSSLPTASFTATSVSVAPTGTGSKKASSTSRRTSSVCRNGRRRCSANRSTWSRTVASGAAPLRACTG